MKVVISQSMYFPWVGLLEQIRLSDIFIHYDDVAFSRGGFLNRVQVKTGNGVKWLTIPLRDQHLGQRIDEVHLDDRKDWREQHRDILRQSYLKAPYRDEMLMYNQCELFMQIVPRLKLTLNNAFKMAADLVCCVEARSGKRHSHTGTDA